MKICYLLESSELCGGVRVVFDQMRALQSRGHTVFARAKRSSHCWYHHPVTVRYVSDLAEPFPPEETPDAVVATFWTTVRPALAIGCPHTFHLCQGHEADIPEFAAIRDDIMAAYHIPIPKITLGAWLVSRLRSVYGDTAFPVHLVGQIVDTEICHPPGLPFMPFVRRLFHAPARLLIVGRLEISVKAVADALHAVAQMRAAGQKIHLTWVSGFAPDPVDQQITPVQSRHSEVTPQRLAAIYRTTDLFLAPTLEGEGFGLPFAEALASGVPCVATSIPSYLSFDPCRDYAVFVPQQHPQAMARAALDLLADPERLAFLRRRGPQVVRQAFRGADVAQRLEQVFCGVAA